MLVQTCWCRVHVWWWWATVLRERIPHYWCTEVKYWTLFQYFPPNPPSSEVGVSVASRDEGRSNPGWNGNGSSHGDCSTW